MADITDIRIEFEREEQATEAAEIAKGMIKLFYATREKDKPAWAEEAVRIQMYTQAYAVLRDRMTAYDPTESCPYCAIKRVRQEGKVLFIDSCGDVVRGFLLTDGNGLFPQLCAACALLFPGSSFEGVCRYEMTVSASVNQTEIRYDGKLLHTRELYADEDCEDGEWKFDIRGTYAVEPDGTLREL